MQQIRPPGGNDPRWFCPDRDLVYALPRYLRQAMFVRFGGEDPRTKRSYGPYNYDVTDLSEQAFSDACIRLKRLFFDMRDGSIKEGQLSRRIGEIHPVVLRELAPVAIQIMLAEYWEWAAYVSPKETPPDKPIDMSLLERKVNDFVRHLRKGNRDDEAPAD